MVNQYVQKMLKDTNYKPLGRWGLLEEKRKIDNRVDWSNEDHCGPCGQELVKKKYEHTDLKKK